jgi:hypothetical protein
MQNVAENKALVVLLLVTGREKRSGKEKWYLPVLQMKAETRNCDEKCEYEKVS